MEKKLVIFVSSVINELMRERDIAKKAIESIDISIPWLFECSPASSEDVETSYLNKVTDCDIFVLILAAKITKPVELEYQTAKICKKPRLIFIKEVTDSSPELEDFISNIDVKYRKFTTPEEFQEVVKESIADHILNAVRKGNLNNLNDTDIETLEKIRQLPTVKVLTDFTNAKFYPLKMFEVKSPLELIKETPYKDRVLPAMSQLSKFDNILEQINFAKQTNYADIYSDSWAERELQLVGFFLLRKLANHIDKFTDMYDAGCANCGQYRSLITLRQVDEEKVSSEFKYYGQDFNPDWEQKFNVKDGKFFLKPLPLVELDLAQKHTLVCCTHTIHYLEQNPLAMYTSLFSFNNLLRPNGYCFITVPEKATQPGMLNLLEKAAIDAGFEIIESGKHRLIHRLIEEPYNITTFLYLIIQKREEVDYGKWQHLLGASFFRAKHKKISEQFNINREGDIKEDVRLLEIDLREILKERASCLRTFRYALDVVNNSWKGKIPEVEECRKNIQSTIREIHELIVDTNAPNRKARLQSKCGCYLYWLAGFYVSSYNGLDLRQIVFYIYPMVKRILDSSEDIRVHIEDLTDEQVARLFRHLFELCQDEDINMREALEKGDFTACL